MSSIMQIYFKYIFQAEAMSTIALLCLLGTTMIFIPIWTPLIKRIGKNTSYAIGLFIIAAVTIIVFFLAPVLGMVFMFVMMVIAGIGLAATYVAPYTMIPDTIEYDQVHSGQREEGSYYGLWTFFSQTGQAMAGLISGLVLQVMLFANNTPVQAPEALLGIRLLLGPIPAVFLVLAGVIVLFYPINEKVYAQIMAKRKEISR
jgi:GPH family glycoside/pentoside/hexuronide:cation symporter